MSTLEKILLNGKGIWSDFGAKEQSKYSLPLILGLCVHDINFFTRNGQTYFSKPEKKPMGFWVPRKKHFSPVLNNDVIVRNIEKNTVYTAFWSSCKAVYNCLPQRMEQWELASDLVVYWSSNWQFYKISSSFVTVPIIYDSASSNSSKVYLTGAEH